MDVKDLNKSQLILLAILLSFITSIATGITTVTLMEQAPSSVTVPMNRVIQNTVERIVQVPGNTTTNTVVVKEEDLVVDAISTNQNSIFTITRDGQDLEGNTIELALGKGFVVSNNDIVVMDGSSVFQNSKIYVKNNSGKFQAELISTNTAGFAFLKIGAPIDPKDKLVYTLPDNGDLTKMKIGQKVLVFGGSLNSFIYDGNPDLKMTINKANSGSMVLDLDGKVIGIGLSGETNSFASIDKITTALKALDIKTP